MKKNKTPTFLLELPLRVDSVQAKHLRAHFEAARQLYNALLGEALRRMNRMRADPAWQAARAIPRSQKQARRTAFSHLRQDYCFSEYALHAFAKEARCVWIADHIDSVMAQTLATRAYRAVNQMCIGKARKVRFKSRGRGLDSVENKCNDMGLRFVLQHPEEENEGVLVWGKDRIPVIIDWNDPVVKHGLDHRIKYARLLRRKASSPRAQGADCQGFRYYVQLALEGTPFQKPKNSKGYVATRRRLAHQERKLAAHRKSLHGKLVNEIVRAGNHIHIEKASYKGWQKQYGKSVGLRAPGMLIEHLRRTVASTGGTLNEVPTRTTKLSQYCHGCGRYEKKPLSQRWHHCPCGIGPLQRDLYSALLIAYLNPSDTRPSIAHDQWERAELRVRAAVEVLQQRAKEGQSLPRSVGVPRAGARLPKSLAPPQQELVYRQGRLEALG